MIVRAAGGNSSRFVKFAAVRYLGGIGGGGHHTARRRERSSGRLTAAGERCILSVNEGVTLKHSRNLSAVLLCVILPALAFGQGAGGTGTSEPGRPLLADYAIESAGALATGFAMVIPLSLLAYFLSPDDGQGSGVAAGIVGGASAAAFVFGCPVGANLAGNARGWSGSFGRSLGFALIPPAAALGILYLGSEANSDALMVAGVAVAVVGTPVMASVGYNVGAIRGEPRSWENRLAPPSFAARVTGSSEDGAEACIDVRLVAVRF